MSWSWSVPDDLGMDTTTEGTGTMDTDTYDQDEADARDDFQDSLEWTFVRDGML